MSKLAVAWRVFVQQQDWTHFVTLTSNDRNRASKSMRGEFASEQSAIRFMKDRLHHWDARVNRAIHGRYWASPGSDRLVAVAALEKAASNPHWHLLVSVPSSTLKKGFEESVARSWQQLVPAGSTNTQVITSKLGVTRYLLKTRPFVANGELLEFLPSKP